MFSSWTLKSAKDFLVIFLVPGVPEILLRKLIGLSYVLVF